MCIFGGKGYAYQPQPMEGFSATGYLAANPDVSKDYQAKAATNPDFAARFPNEQLYASYHAATYAPSEGRNISGAGGTPADAAAQATTDITGQLQSNLQTTMQDLSKTNQGVLDGLKDLGTNLTGMIGDLTKGFATSQSELIAQMQDASAAQAKSIAQAIKDAQNANGQAEKKPNYARALQKNKELNSAGLSATMITGPTGVAPGALTLSAPALLGA